MRRMVDAGNLQESSRKNRDALNSTARRLVQNFLLARKHVLHAERVKLLTDLQGICELAIENGLVLFRHERGRARALVPEVLRWMHIARIAVGSETQKQILLRSEDASVRAATEMLSLMEAEA